MTRTELDPKLQHAVNAGTPVELVDPATNETYYLISAEQYRLLSSTIEGDFDPREGYSFIDQVMAEDDADDPLLDSYQ
jgi:hypothetical protein